ncbi:MAG TPA: YbbR-like domain-containing protein [Bacteroidales bacterium]|nr:YbbR-like domain-containing protein [Bacteroidales bacterium]
MSLKNIIIDSWDKLQTTFKTVNWSKVGPFFLFLILAFVFWLLLFFERTTDGSYSIPLKYTNFPMDEVFTENRPSQIDVKIRDKGNNLLRYLFRKRDSLVIDVSEAQRNNKTTLQGNELTQLIHTKLSADAQIIGYMPASIQIETHKLYSKTVPVVFDGDMRTDASNLIVGESSVLIIPSEVKIRGSKEQLENITEITTEHTPFENLKATSQLPAKLKPIEGVIIEPKLVEVYIPIYEYTEKEFDIPILSKNSPNSLDVKFFPSKVKVSFYVTLDDYKRISEDDFKIVIDYNLLRTINSEQVELSLTSLPPFVRNPKITPETVEFLFEHK